MVAIKDTYDDATLLVTGATGFVGKAFVEKLLRSCTKVGKVFLMIRTRKDMTSDQRLEKLKNHSVFDRIRAANPSALDKLVAVSGDIGFSPNMGLSANDEKLLIEQVNFVMHAAATVNFSLPFSKTSNLNILGTMRILELSTKMKMLKCIVYVSTAYTGIHSPAPAETLHPLKKPLDINRFLEVVTTGTEDEMLAEAYKYQDPHPNMYTLSKIFAEYVVDHYRRKCNLNACIVRPTLVGCAYMEPTPGWTDSFNGPIAPACESGRGALKCVYSPVDIKFDWIPVDFVCNLMFVAAWWSTANPTLSEIRIYNHTLGYSNLPTYKEAAVLMNIIGRNYPSKYAMMYPDVKHSESYIYFMYCRIMYQYIPAYITDALLVITGEKPRAVDIARRFNKGMQHNYFCRITVLKFKYDNLLAVTAASQTATDHSEFTVYGNNLDVEEFMRIAWLGIRKHLLKETEADDAKARQRMSILYAISWIYLMLQVFIVVYLVWKLIGYCI